MDPVQETIILIHKLFTRILLDALWVLNTEIINKKILNLGQDHITILSNPKELVLKLELQKELKILRN
jgi:hypothetical protein